MSDSQREQYLKVSLKIFGIIFLFIYPLGLIWPSGWIWHGGAGEYYLQMICGLYFVLGLYLIKAAKNPDEHKSLISFTIWSSVVHGGIMMAQAIMDNHEMGHLAGDVPALFLVAIVLHILSPKKNTVEVDS